ncbi:MAG: hypothetical protein ACR2PX_26300 [Endozoicomonas sp.]|uniref:hypothetical protein n=1 Tax=Endozoicomonas sp. TaxID=1892382 RepID=UPI003D9B2170
MQSQGASESAPGLYAVEFSTRSNQWEADQRKRLQPNYKKQIVHEPYIAVCGKYDDLTQASNKMVEHIQGAYKLRSGQVASRSSAYNLFWQPAGFNDDSNVESLASIIQQSQEQEDGVSWLVQGEGAKTFVMALEKLRVSSLAIKKAGLSTQPSYKPELKTINHRVFFSSPRGKGTGKDDLKRLSEHAGMQFIGIQYNDYDLQNPDIRKNFRISCEKVGATAFLTGGAGTAALKTTGVGSLIKLSEQAMQAPLYGKAGIAVIGFLAIKNVVYPTLSSYGRAFANFGGNTFGKGNQSWQG